MDIAIIIGLLALGIFFFILEFFFIPGFSISGITGGILLIVAVWFAYHNFSSTAGHLTLTGSVLLVGISIWLFARSKTFDKMSLKTNVDSKVDSINENEIKVGDKGTTISRLAPMGKVKINGKIIEAKVADGFVDESSKVTVIEVYKTNVLVEKI